MRKQLDITLPIYMEQQLNQWVYGRLSAADRKEIEKIIPCGKPGNVVITRLKGFQEWGNTVEKEEMEETNMKMIKAIVRPEKSEDVLDALLAGGFAAATKMSVLGRGKQKGLKVGDTYYDEIPKELIMLVVEDKDVDKVLKVIVENARVDKNGTYGDGKIFVSDVERAITISSGKDEL